MAIEVRIPKEIKEYKEKIIFGLSLRQLVSVLIGGGVCLATYFLLKPSLGSNLASDIIIFEAMPIFAFGFIKIRSFNFEEFAKILLEYKLTSKKRTYGNKLNVDLIREIKEENSIKKEVKNVDKNKCRKEIERPRTIGRNAKIKEIRRRIKIAKKEFKEETKRKETAELEQSKEQLEIAKSNYQRARKRKSKDNK